MTQNFRLRVNYITIFNCINKDRTLNSSLHNNIRTMI